MSTRSDVPTDPQRGAFVLHRREQPPTPVQRRARMALRVVTVLLLAVMLIDLAARLLRHGP